MSGSAIAAHTADIYTYIYSIYTQCLADSFLKCWSLIGVGSMGGSLGSKSFCVCVCVCVFMCHLPVVSAHCPRRQKRSAVAPGSGWLTRLKLMAPVIMKSNRSHDEQEEEVEATQRT